MNNALKELEQQCWNCNFLNVKKRNIKTKKWTIQCCNSIGWHEISDVENTPKHCPYYAERIMTTFYIGENK